MIASLFHSPSLEYAASVIMVATGIDDQGHIERIYRGSLSIDCMAKLTYHTRIISRICMAKLTYHTRIISRICMAKLTYTRIISRICMAKLTYHTRIISRICGCNLDILEPFVIMSLCLVRVDINTLL